MSTFNILFALHNDCPSIAVSDLSLGHLTETVIKNFAYIFMGQSGLPNLNKMEASQKGTSLNQFINMHAEKKN